MSIRVMPKKMQIICFKRLFLKWNAWQEVTPGYDTSAKIDEIDWDAVVIDGESFPENLHHLKNNYPQYSFGKNDNPDAIQKKMDDAIKEQMEIQVKRTTQKYEVYALQQQQEVPIPEDLEEPETPAGEWKIEQSEGIETRTIELEVLPHRTISKGKTYEYGRIQLIVDKNLVGCPVKIIIKVLKI